VYTAGGADENIWRIDIAAPNRAPLSRRLIGSTYSDRNPQFSPDGKRIVFVSTRSGRNEIWVCDQDGSGEEKLTSMEAQMTGSPRWSPDGEQVVYDSNALGQFDVYVISAKGGRPRRLTTEPTFDAVASWSRDGKWIYFVSNRTGQREVWKSANGGNAVRITNNGGYVAFESKDGKSLYYTKTLNVATLFKVPVEGGRETKVIDAVQGASFAVAEKGIYFIPPADISGRSSIQFFAFSTGRTQQVAVLENPTGITSLSVSPDGRSFLYTRVDQEDSDLMLVDNFR
jgi:Tol biopolymer transport system component